MKTFRDRAYSVCDNCSEGLMIFDLSNLPASVTKTNQTTQFFSRAHNIYIDEEAGRLYVAGSNTKSNGVIVLDLNGDPDNPTDRQSHFARRVYPRHFRPRQQRILLSWN
ncbi:MAG: hypothetical protein IPH04_15815 [Saprospirales bacterium]|nr:hypothetical protein [Saprospirales bacterium]